jgi:hypothetical protein
MTASEFLRKVPGAVGHQAALLLDGGASHGRSGAKRSV